MSKPRELPDHKPREKFTKLIVDGLGFCCLWSFFKVHRKVRASVIAVRLGVHPDTVKNYRNTTCQCEKKEGCLKSKVYKMEQVK